MHSISIAGYRDQQNSLLIVNSNTPELTGRLSEDMYSQQDVKGILDGLRGCVVTNLRQEVGYVCTSYVCTSYLLNCT